MSSGRVVRDLAAVVLAGALPGTHLLAETVELKAGYKSFTSAPQCEASVVKRVRVHGPGEATMHVSLAPYRSAGKADLIPVSFGEYKGGRFQGWQGATPFVYVSSEVTQAGRVVSSGYVEGLPLEKVGHYRLEAREYEFDVRISPPCQMHGSAGFEQWSQRTEVTLQIGASGSSSPKPAPAATAAARSLAGRWVAKVGGQKTGDCSIEQSGSELVLVIHRTPEERSRGRFVDATAVVADGWGPQRGRVSADGNRIEWQGSVWERVDGAAGGTAPPPAAPVVPSIAGRWQAWAGGTKTGDCSIEQSGETLAFVIHRSPQERSTGRFLDSVTVVAEQWGPQRGRLSADGRRIDWANSFWKRID